MPDAAALAPSLREAPPLPAPQTGEPWPRFVEGDDLFYPGATEIVVVAGTTGSGHATAWIRLRGDLLPGVAPSPLFNRAGRTLADWTVDLRDGD